MEFQNKNQKKGDVSPSADSRTIAERFKIIRKISDSPLNIFAGLDIDQQCDILIIEIDTARGKDNRQLISEHSHDDPALQGILKPSHIVEDDNSYFAIFSLPKGMTLQENIDMMDQLGQPFKEAEIIRIGQQLYNLSTNAEANKLVPLIRPDLVHVTIDGELCIIVLEPQYIPGKTVSYIKPPMHSIATILKEMTRVGRQSASSAPGKEDSGIPPNLEKFIQLPSNEDFHSDNPDVLLHAFKQQDSNQQYRKGFTRLGIGIIIFIAAISFFSIYEPVDFSENEAVSETARLTTEDLKTDAHATAKEWTILIASKRINTPPQAIDAEYLLSRGDESFSTMQYEKAQLAYRQSIVLYEAAIVTGKEIVRRKTDAENARELMRLSQSRWSPLFGSVYVQLQDQVKRASDTALEGDFQYLKQQYGEAVIAYELARQLYDTIPTDKYKELISRHQSGTARDRATIAANAWDKLEAKIDSKSIVAASDAKEQIATGEGLLKSEQYVPATHAFNEAATLFETATRTAIESMVARVTSANAYERAIEAAQRWQNLFKAMKQTSEPYEITEAKNTLEKAHKLATEDNHKQSAELYQRSAALYELQTQYLNDNAETLAENYLKRAMQMIESLAKSQKGLENRLADARKQFETLHTQLPQDQTTEHHEQFLKKSTASRRHYSSIKKLSSYCIANVYSGVANEKARSMLTEGQNLIIQGEYVAAFIMLENAADELTILSELPVAIENFLSMEEQALASKEKSMKVIGPVASELPEVKKLLDLGNNSLSSTNELLRTREVSSAVQTLEDAKFAFDSLPQQAEVELMNYAISADSELRTEIAIAALNELFTLNPDNQQARDLLQKIESSDRSTKRITIFQGKIRYNGKNIPFSPSEQALLGVLGKQSRTLSNNLGLIFDDIGVRAIPEPVTKRFFSITVFYAQPLQKIEPKTFYSGIIEVEGVPIGRDDSIEKINSSLKHIPFKKARSSNSYERTYKGLRILIHYKQRSSQIYSISMLYVDDHEG